MTRVLVGDMFDHNKHKGGDVLPCRPKLGF
jgi:hypothetical protein